MKERRLRRYFTLFSLFFLLFAFTGCDTQQETVSETSQQPTQETVLEMDWKDNKQTIPNLRVIAEDQQWILLEQDSESPEINYRFLVYVTDDIWIGTWKDQNGEIADPGQFAVNVECTLVMREGKQLQQPAVYRLDNQTVRYLYLLDTNTLDGLYLDGQTNQEPVQPFFD